MQIYDQKDKRSPNSCSYCRQPGHNVTKCPHVAPDWASWQRMEVPLKDPDCWVHTAQSPYHRMHPFKYPRFWGEWYQAAMIASHKQKRAQERESAPRRAKAERKCGFCGETGHTRRTCAELLVFREKANRANQAIRKYVYDQLVSEHGIDVGALIEPKVHKYHYSSGEYVQDSYGICTVTDVNWEKVSVTSDWALANNRTLSWDLRTPIEVSFITPDGFRGKVQIELHKGVLPKVDADVRYTPSRKPYISQVISPSPTPLDEGWVQQARQDAFDWLSKKRNLEWIKNKGLSDLIDGWAARYEDPEQSNESR